MSVKDIRRWACDSCTKSAEAAMSGGMRLVPRGWVQVSLSNESHANHKRWWCPSCVEVITRQLPNALGEFATNWPHHDNLDPNPPAPRTFEDRFADAIRRDQETGALPKPLTPHTKETTE